MVLALEETRGDAIFLPNTLPEEGDRRKQSTRVQAGAKAERRAAVGLACEMQAHVVESRASCGRPREQREARALAEEQRRLAGPPRVAAEAREEESREEEPATAACT